MNKKTTFVSMNVASYINDLLYRYDCVIVPNFGGFVTNKISARVNNFTHTFNPPAKQITFNSHLKHNDGLLANYIASSENITFEAAVKKIEEAVVSWQESLQTNAVTIDAVGTLALNEEKQLVFEPNKATNYLTEAFGLSTVQSSAIERYKQEVKPLPVTNDEVVTSPSSEKRIIPAFIKYAATAAILVTLGTAGYKMHVTSQEKEAYSKQLEKVDEKIQSATFVIDQPLPAINLTVEKAITKEFHLIAGSFQKAENADKKLQQLINQGYNARILGVNKWGLIQVAFDSYETKEEAKKELYTIQNQVNPDAWLLVKKFD